MSIFSPFRFSEPLLSPYTTIQAAKANQRKNLRNTVFLSVAGVVALMLGFSYFSADSSSDTAATGDAAQITSASASNAAPVNMAATSSNKETPSSSTPAASRLSQLPVSIQLQVNGGDTLLNILTDTGVTYEEAYSAVEAIRKIYDPRKLDIGQNIAVSLDPSEADPAMPMLSSLSLPISQTASVQVSRLQGGEFDVKKIDAPLQRQAVSGRGVITSSLYETGLKLGVPANMLAEMIKVYSYDVDFQRDIKAGNQLEVVYERMQTEDGKVAGYGNLLYAQLTLGKRTLPFFRYTDKSGTTDYYNAKGESLRKALLRTPINGAKVTSGFGMRKHPILGYSKMHRGVDFGAATGTPIYAAGDGVIAFAGVKGGYGNYVQIKHNAKYATAYGHASRIAKGIRSGVKVRQGQVIAYVGSTGRSTGPHLHYEILASGTQVNPSGVKFKTGNSLSGRELASFKANITQVQALLKSGGKTKVASNETPDSSARN